MPKEMIKKWGVIIICLVAFALIGYKAYTLHYTNTVWCVSHEQVCRISRLQNSAEELQKVEKLTEVAK
jgi:hypothetical protein